MSTRPNLDPNGFAYTLVRVAATPAFLWLGIGGLAALCAAAAEVPQGVSDSAIVGSLPLSIGPYVAVLGLHHLGRSVVLWLTLILIGAHFVFKHCVVP